MGHQKQEGRDGPGTFRSKCGVARALVCRIVWCALDPQTRRGSAQKYKSQAVVRGANGEAARRSHRCDNEQHSGTTQKAGAHAKRAEAMAKKKRKSEPPSAGQPRFAGLKVVVIGATKPQRTLWASRIGAGFVPLARGACLQGALEEHGDATHIVSCVGSDRPLAHRAHQDVPRAHLVHEAWISTSLAHGAGGPLASENAHEWTVPDSQELAMPDTPMSQDDEARFCVLLMVDARDEDAVHYRTVCSEACADVVREACRFPDEHLHVTLAEGRCTGREAGLIRLRSAVPPLRRVAYGPPKPWGRCLALGLEDAQPIHALATDLDLPASLKLKNPGQYHVSLYRSYGRGDELALETGKMKAAGREVGRGSSRAVKVVVKVVGADYASARTIAEIPRRTPLKDVRVAFVGDTTPAIRARVVDAGALVVEEVERATFVVCGELSSDGAMIIERTRAFQAATKPQLLDAAAMRRVIEAKDRVALVTPDAPPEFKLDYLDTQSQESGEVWWPLRHGAALGIDLPDSWRASRDGQLVGRVFHGPPVAADVTYGFDFDGTVSVRKHGAQHVTHVERFPHQVEVLRRLHAAGAAFYVATNESIAHTANWAPEKRLAHLSAKLVRLEAFAASLGADVPLLVVVALTNREGDCHKRGPAKPRGMWRAAKAALGVSGGSHTYVGDLGGQNGAHNDDRRFAETNGLAFFSETEFFEARHPAREPPEDSPAFEPAPATLSPGFAAPEPEPFALVDVADTQQDAFPAPAPLLPTPDSAPVEFGVDYVDTQTQDELAPPREAELAFPAPAPRATPPPPPFEIIALDSQTQGEAAPPREDDAFLAPEPRAPEPAPKKRKKDILDTSSDEDVPPTPAPSLEDSQPAASPPFEPAPAYAETYAETYAEPEEPFADVACPHLRALLERQTEELPRAISELEARGEKTSHWARWCFPTDLCGTNEPPPATCVAPHLAATLLERGPVEIWRRCLELVCDLSEARGELVLPKADHGRVAFFVAFWERLDATPAWLYAVLTRLAAARAPVLTRQLARARRLSAPAPAPADIITVDESQAAPAPKKRKRDILSDSSDDEAFPAYAFPGVPPRPARFSNALKPPHASLAYAASGDGRLVYDGYPKARRHLLGLAAPRTALSGVAGVADLCREHLPALKKLHAFCRNAADALGVPCRVGYHAKPSLEPLHVHVMSVDLDSEFLKNKRHFASFATDRFVDASRVERALATGMLADLLVSRDGDALTCHRCGEARANMPALKRHLAACAAPPPAAWDVIGATPRKRARDDDDDDDAPAPEIIVLDETQDGDAAMAPSPPIRAGSPRDDALITPDAAAARTGPERFSVVTSESGRKPRRAPALSPRRAPAPKPIAFLSPAPRPAPAPTFALPDYPPSPTGAELAALFPSAGDTVEIIWEKDTTLEVDGAGDRCVVVSLRGPTPDKKKKRRSSTSLPAFHAYAELRSLVRLAGGQAGAYQRVLATDRRPKHVHGKYKLSLHARGTVWRVAATAPTAGGSSSDEEED